MKYLTVCFCIMIIAISGSSSLSVFNGIKNRLRGLPINNGQCFKNVHRPKHKFKAWATSSPCAADPVFDRNTTKHDMKCGCNIPTLEVTCLPGLYFSDGSSFKTYSCQCDGWGDIENCTEIACDPLKIVNADVDPAGPHTYPRVVNVTCTSGYNTPDGQESYQTECRSDGTWSKNTPCIYISQTCAGMAQNNTRLKDGMLPQLSSPESIVVVCESGYLTSRALDWYEAMCLEDGTWNLTESCDYNGAKSCPVTPIYNTVPSELPPTVDGGTYDVECSGSDTLPDGSTSYTANCTDGTWDMAICGNFTCEDIYAAGTTASGVYTIFPDGMTPMEVYCQNNLTETGWTVIQQRLDCTTDFLLNWEDYQVGFGDANSNYWLGLDNIRLLTQGMDMKLRVYMRHADTTMGPNGDGYAWADYNTFYIEDEASNYTLRIANFSDGGAGDSMSAQNNGSPFSTPDRDNDNSIIDCAEVVMGAWWYGSCTISNLNGLYIQKTPGTDMIWTSYSGFGVGLTFTQMMIKTSDSD